MSLPRAFSNPDEYFTAAVEFLAEHAWIYKRANTRCVQSGIFEYISTEVIDYFVQRATSEQLNALPLLHCVSDCPLELVKFQERLQLLTSSQPITPAELAEQCSAQMAAEERELTKDLRKVSAKKCHEILKLSKVIVDALDAERDHVLVDFGAGLGYLSETVYKRMRRKSPSRKRLLLLGLESEQARVVGAEQRQQQYLPETNGDLRYRQMYIDGNSQSSIEEMLEAHIERRCADDDDGEGEGKEERLNNFVGTIVGLHACADLSVHAMELFLRMRRIRNLIIMPCCYHKLQLQQSDDDAHTFLHFPLSQSLRRAVATTKANVFFNRPFLRLACQETRARWSTCTDAQHLVHGRAMFWRAAAEALAHTTGNQGTNATAVTQSKNSIDFKDFATFSQHYKLRCRTSGELLPWQQHHAEQFAALLQRFGNDVGAKLAEGLTCLQTALQPLCENLVLFDRLCHMEECASAANVRLKVCYRKVLNEKLSPRCYALIASKS